MAWVYLVIAGLFEMGWAIGLKYTEGFTKLVPTSLTVLAMVISVALLGLALRDPAGRHRLLPSGPASAPSARRCWACISSATRPPSRVWPVSASSSPALSASRS